MTKKRLIETASERVQKAISNLLRSDYLLLCAYADIDAQGRFAREWIALTDERVLLLNEETLRAESVPLLDIRDSQTEPLVGGGRLVIQRRHAAAIKLYYFISTRKCPHKS